MEHPLAIEKLTRRNVAVIAEMEREAAQVRTRWDRVADRLASWVGSWTFLMIRLTILVMRIVLNISGWLKVWDPYPFILLNLALAFQAAYAAPILMISQNRQSKLSERRNHLDLQSNMLAEQGNTVILRLLRLLCEHSGVRLDEADNGRAFEEETKHAQIVRQIEGGMEELSTDSSEASDRSARGGRSNSLERLRIQFRPGEGPETRLAASLTASSRSSPAP